METKNKILRAIIRSENAYYFYSQDKKYFQALRIYYANQIIYKLLNEYIYECEEIQMEQVTEYLFHLEDWFAQFEKEMIKIDNLNQEFVFYRFDNSIAFPKDFKKILL
jgi:hypothetical protein